MGGGRRRRRRRHDKCKDLTSRQFSCCIENMYYAACFPIYLLKKAHYCRFNPSQVKKSFEIYYWLCCMTKTVKASLCKHARTALSLTVNTWRGWHCHIWDVFQGASCYSTPQSNETHVLFWGECDGLEYRIYSYDVTSVSAETVILNRTLTFMFIPRSYKGKFLRFRPSAFKMPGTIQITGESLQPTRLNENSCILLKNI